MTDPLTLPRIDPIIPIRRKEPFDNPGWLFDCKYDGFRAVCYVQQRRGRLVSRRGLPMSRFDELGDRLAAVLELDEAILDGEGSPPTRPADPSSTICCGARGLPPMSLST